jgi:pyruvate dehydrogenase E1 component alpha subunit
LAENPLLPHRKLKELHALILRYRALDRALRGKTKYPAREALLAASAIHLHPSDLVFSESNDTVTASLAPPPRKSPRRSKSAIVETAAFNLPRLAAAAGAANSLNRKSKNFVLAFTHENAIEPNWTATLRFAQANKIPLLFVVAGIYPHPKLGAATKANRNAFTWEGVGRLCSRLHLPLLPVDGEDAVALFRVFQESSFHARAGAAPAVIWAMFHPTTVALTRSQTPIARLEAYCRARGIKL